MQELNENKDIETEKDDEAASQIFNIEKHCLRHILLGMAISGCYNPFCGTNSRRCFTVYRIFVLLVLLTFLAKTASGFPFISTMDYFGHAIVLGWNASSVLTFFITLRMNISANGSKESTFEFWNTTVLPQMVNLGIKFDEDGFKRKQMVLCIMAATIVVFIEITCILQLIGLVEGSNTATSTTPFDRTLLTSVVQVLLILVCCLQIYIPTFYMIVICYMLTHCFKAFNQYLNRELFKESCRVPQNMPAIRQYFINLCKTVDDFDKDFRYLLGNIFFWNVTLSLFILYVILRVKQDNSEIKGIFVFWLLLCMTTVVVMSVFAACVHESAHAPLNCIYYINVEDITVEKLAQLNLFLSKLTGTQIGFSTCGLLIITKEFILSIAGVFLTYFAVLYTL